ncbi:MAG: hypothetical protein AAF827_22940 [Cyanobacteria bacterium P01_D01_bin.6]
MSNRFYGLTTATKNLVVKVGVFAGRIKYSNQVILLFLDYSEESYGTDQ